VLKIKCESTIEYHLSPQQIKITALRESIGSMEPNILNLFFSSVGAEGTCSFPEESMISSHESN